MYESDWDSVLRSFNDKKKKRKMIETTDFVHRFKLEKT